MENNGSWIVAAIVGAELAFWVILLSGLAARYLLKLRRTSTVLLVSVPLVDLALILLVALDLSRGAEPTFVHGLAAVYLGFSVGFGHHVIGRMDGWFAHRFAGGPRPEPAPRSGAAKVRHYWQEWLRVLVAATVAIAGLLLMKAFSGWSLPASFDGVWTDEIWSWIGRLVVVVVIWFIAGPAAAALSGSPDSAARPVDSGDRRG